MRLTINQLLESVLGKSCALDGEIGDSTPFTSSSIDIAETICDRLGMKGYQRSGNEMLYNGMSGEPMGMCFIGPVYYQRLKHLVSDKIHARSTGPVTTLCRQPTEGRSRQGGQSGLSREKFYKSYLQNWQVYIKWMMKNVRFI